MVERQASLVQSALNELMHSTRNEHVIETVRLTELVTQTLEIVPDACRQRLTIDADESLGRSAPCAWREPCCDWCCRT